MHSASFSDDVRTPLQSGAGDPLRVPGPGGYVASSSHGHGHGFDGSSATLSHGAGGADPFYTNQQGNPSYVSGYGDDDKVPLAAHGEKFGGVYGDSSYQ
jgi:hypothetical protein